jgi:hypothetical protein
MFDISDSLVESLAEADWEENDRNAIVARIARITMTTISSTRVKAKLIRHCESSEAERGNPS